VKTDSEALWAAVPAGGADYDWKALLELVPALARLDDTPQDPIHHAEGDVGLHTRMVLDALLADPAYAGGDREFQLVTFTAALLHDIAKPDTTMVDPETGRVSQPGHSRRGAIDARVLLWDMGVPVELRERICRIVATHQQPFFAFASRRGERPELIVRRLSWQLRLPELVAVARADMTGRVTASQASHLQDIALFEELAREEGCWDAPKAFADLHTALRYFRGANVVPEQVLHREPGSNVTLMSGLPASGKDSWVAQHRKDWPVVSFDDARQELGLRHGKNEGMVAHHALDKARQLLRERRDFVFNATHLSETLRQRNLDLAFGYGATVEIVHLEQTRAVLLARNSKRDSSLPNQALLAMLHRWEPPTPVEAHQVRLLGA
jgi:predicted kinase